MNRCCIKVIKSMNLAKLYAPTFKIIRGKWRAIYKPHILPSIYKFCKLDCPSANMCCYSLPHVSFISILYNQITHNIQTHLNSLFVFRTFKFRFGFQQTFYFTKCRSSGVPCHWKVLCPRTKVRNPCQVTIKHWI